MKKLMIMCAMATGLAGHLTPAKATLPLCSVGGDADGDLVPDSEDSTIDDSCLLSNTGFEDCETGEGDGIPDCAW